MESARLSIYARCQEKTHTQCQTTKPKKSHYSVNALSSSCADGLIAPLVLETLPRGELTRRAQEIAARLYDVPHSIRRQVSVDTLLEWTLRYRRNGLTALHPKPRNDRGQQRAVTPETAALIDRLKRANPWRKN